MGKDRLNKLKRYMKDDRPARFRSYMKKHSIDLNELKLSGHRTLLHYCGKHGSGTLLRLLLEEGLNAAKQDKNGDTCLHVVLRRILDMPFLSHICEEYVHLVMPLIGKYPDLLNIENHDNISCRELLVTVERKKKRLQVKLDKSGDFFFVKENKECEEEQKTTHNDKQFFEKLSEEANDEYYEHMGRFEHDCGESESQYETHDEWCNRISSEYHRKQNTKQSQSIDQKKKRKYFDNDSKTESTNEKVRKAHKEMTERYERNRKAQQRLNVKIQKSKYEMLYKELCNDVSDSCLKFKEIPWPFQNNLTIEGLKAFIFCDIHEGDDDLRKKYLREQQIRWHPDKFIQRFGERIDGEEGERIMTTVKEISQILNDLSSA